VLRRIGLLVALVLVWSPVAAARTVPPRLPEKAEPNSVASFPCPRSPVSTIDIEACEGHALLKLDHVFNERASVLWSLLDSQGRRGFVAAHAAWLSYRKHECNVRSREAVGGTAAGVIFGQCEVDLTHAHVAELSTTLNGYCQGRARTGPYRKCP
jgi:uncharacterized protein YecT (DUF1311 family)